jgi:hypothetical protein
LPVSLRRKTAVTVAQVKLMQGIGQVVHQVSLHRLSVTGSEKQTVSVLANSLKARSPKGQGPGAQFACGLA